MRSPERIGQILQVLHEIWEENPDLRLGQLIVNAARLTDPAADVFNIEDNALLKGMRDYQLVRRRLVP